MADPIYGTNPIDPGDLWDQTFRPPLVLDPEWVSWRNVMGFAFGEVAESQWLSRWRRPVSTAEGAQLDARGDELVYPRPDGWSDDRYRPVLMAIEGASFSIQTTAVVFALADALLDGVQTMTFTEQYPCSATFVFLETSADDSVAYFSALDRARPRGCQFFLIAHPGGGGAPFMIGTSTIDGPDTLADLFA